MITLIWERICETGLFLVVVWLACSIGNRLLRALGAAIEDAIQKLVFSLALGLAALGYIVFIMGAAGILYRWVLYLTVILGFIVFYREARHVFTVYVEKIKPAQAIQVNLFNTAVFLIAAVTAFLLLLGSLAPPSFYDTLVYHMAIPGIYIKNHAIVNVPYNFFSNFPELGEMLFTAGMLLYNDILAKLISFIFPVITAAGVYSIIKRYYGHKPACFAGLCFLTAPAVMLISTDAYVDLMLTCFIFLSFYSFIMWHEDGSSAGLLMTGIFCGSAFGVKYTGGVAFVILALFVMLKTLSGKDHKKFILNIMLLSAPFMVLALPWLVKNYVYTGNPVFPFLFSTESQYWGQENAGRYFSHIRAHGIEIKNVFDFILIPWRLTVEGYRFGGGLDIWGPIIPVSLLLALFSKISKPLVRNAILFTALFYVQWLITGKVARFLLPVMPLLCVAAGGGFFEIFVNRRRIKYLEILMVLIITAALSYNWYMYVFCQSIIDPFKVSAGLESREAYLLRKIPYYPAVKWINENLSDTDTVLFVGETRGYYCRKKYIAATVFNKNPLVEWTKTSASAKELRIALARNGITHVLINFEEIIRLNMQDNIFNWDEKDEQKFNEVIIKSKEVFNHNNYLLVYKLS